MRSYFFKIQGVILLSLCLSLSLLSCGGDGDADNLEMVYLRVFNGYPGTANLTLYGPTGTIVSGLPFGQGTEGAIGVDRSLGVDFTLVLDGIPEEIELTPQLFGLYPQETATLFISRRTDTADADFKIYRHIQAISPACRLVIDNNLSVSNQDEGNFNFIAGWHFPDISIAGYDEQFESRIIDDLNAGVPSCMDLTQFKRDVYFGPGNSLFTRIQAHPFFPLEEGGSMELDYYDNPRSLQWVWIGPEDYVDIPHVDFNSGSVLTHPTSDDFLICMRDVAEQYMGDDADCPEDDDWLDEFVECLREDTYTVTLYRPGDSGSVDNYWIHYYPDSIANPDGVCDADLRIFSDFGNIFQGQHGYDGYVENIRVDFKPEFSISDHFFYVLYGRPVNPRAASWVASQSSEVSGGFVELPPYPGE